MFKYILFLLTIFTLNTISSQDKKSKPDLSILSKELADFEQRIRKLERRVELLENALEKSVQNKT